MSKKITTTVYITEEQNQQLKELNKRTKVPVAEYIREGIDLALQKHADQLPGQMDLLAVDKASIKTFGKTFDKTSAEISGKASGRTLHRSK